MTKRKPRNLGDAKLGDVDGYICTLPNGGVITSTSGETLRLHGVADDQLKRARDGERVTTVAGVIEYR